MNDIPSFFQKFQPPPEPPPPDLAHAISKSQSAGKRRLSFTLLDWEYLDYLCEHPHATNGQLAALFGTTLSAASLRIKRLAGMGLLKLTYETWQETGKPNRRTVDVVSVPPKPWSPE